MKQLTGHLVTPLFGTSRLGSSLCMLHRQCTRQHVHRSAAHHIFRTRRRKGKQMVKMSDETGIHAPGISTSTWLGAMVKLG